MMDCAANGDELVVRAREARKRAYAPYSGYSVGAAIEDSAGVIWTGCNIENVSFGATLCAERVALGNMVAGGGPKALGIAIVTQDGGTPCGICLQSLLEFCQDPRAFRVIVSTESGTVVEYRLSDLLPHGFASLEVLRTDPLV